MKNVLVKVALFAVNKLIRGVDKLLVKKPNSEALKNVLRDLEDVRNKLVNIRF